MKPSVAPSGCYRRRTAVLGLSATVAVVATLAAAPCAHATDYYVATTGSDSAAGTMAAPWATLQKGANTAVAGDTVYIRGGRYMITTPANSGAGINFTKSGTSDSARINYFAYPGEVPIFDFTNLQISTTGYTMGFVVNANFLHFKGLEICCVPMNTSSNNGISVNGSSANDIFEQLNMHHNNGNGIFVGNKSGGGHLILNCDAHDNYDPNSSQGQGQNADGFGVHYQTSGATTIVRGCRAWWNSDDGYDLINQEVPVTVENSWAFLNGYADYGATNPSSGNGNGFKMGSSRTGVRHLVQNNVSWKNKAAGFYANHSTGGNTWYNNTSYSNNSSQYNMLASSFDSSGNVTGTITLSGALAHIMRNNIGFPNSNQNMTGVDTMFNSWDLSLTPATADFASTADPSVSMKGMAIEGMGAMGPRQADGSLPNIDFMKLAAGSKFIDKGTNVMLAYLGTAPDLGAYEYGAAGSSGTGGTSGGAGSGATGAGGTGTGGTTTAGTAGTGAGAAGRGGASGTTGTGARGGTSGGAGTSGTTAGTAGTSGTSAGTAGTSGTSAGTAGTTGTSVGTAGTSGTSAGTAGTGTSTGAAGGSATGAAGANTTGAAGAGVGVDSAVTSGCACAVHAAAGGSGAAAGGSSALASLLAALGALSSLRIRRRRR